MASMTKNIAHIWDREYKNGKYDAEGPIPFVGEIISALKREGVSGKGLYVGCGNGRNYIPLVDQGLDLVGLDTSSIGLEQLVEKYPKARPNLVRASYLNYAPGYPLDYLISIQVFQHGDYETAQKYFKKTADLLKPGSLFFLRVNSVNTDIFFDHGNKRQTEGGGLTITYNKGPKKMLDVHFFSEMEINSLTKDNFSQVSQPKEVAIERLSPKTGKWTQWEGIWRKK
jgi:SAM-dependent methyltransferase